jgi:CRP/FNR family cyclic AMP-dependent transcriptional regulator
MTALLTADDPALDWFGPSLGADARARLAELARVVTYAPGEEVFREGHEADDFGIIRSGRVALRVLVPERGQTTILTCEPGDIVNWSAIVPPYRSTSTGIATEPVEVLAFDGADFRGALRKDCALAGAVYPRVLQAVGRRLIATRNQLLDLFARQANEPW